MYEQIFEETLKHLREGNTVAICTIIKKVGSAPRGVGTKMLVTVEGKRVDTLGGGPLEDFIAKEAINAIKKQKPKTVTLELTKASNQNLGLLCGGTIDVFIDVVSPSPELIIFGAGNLGQYLAQLAYMIGLKVTVVDPDPKKIKQEKYPFAKVVCANVEDAVKNKEIAIGTNTFITIMTRDARTDKAALRAVANSNARYIGMIASKTKAKIIKSELEKEGIPKEKLDRLHAPMGIEIYAETPQEIAISIIAEIIKEIRQPL